MKLLKYNKDKTEWVATFSGVLNKIPETVFYLYPWGFSSGPLPLANGLSIIIRYNSVVDNEHSFTCDRWSDKVGFKFKNQDFYILKGQNMLDNWPTREEFEIFCLENGVDSIEVPFLTQEEICVQMLEVIETMNIKDVVESLRI